MDLMAKVMILGFFTCGFESVPRTGKPCLKSMGKSVTPLLHDRSHQIAILGWTIWDHPIEIIQYDKIQKESYDVHCLKGLKSKILSKGSYGCDIRF